MRKLAVIGGAVAIAVTMFVTGALSPVPGIGSDRAEPATLATAEVGTGYVQQARSEADPSFLTKADRVFDAVLERDPADFQALVGSAVLSGSRHRFDDMVSFARRAIEVNPFSEAGYGALADGLIELGRYRAAEKALSKMIDRKPGMAAYSRVSYLYEQTGDLHQARRWMRSALRAAGRPQDVAFAAYHVGLLDIRLGHRAAAARSFTRAADISPDSAEPLAGMAHLAFVEGDRERAVSLLERALQRYPSIDHMVSLGDLHLVSGDTDLADDYYARALAAEQAYVDNGALPDSELAVFLTDIGRVDEALELARSLHSKVRTGATEEALGWALQNAGSPRRALDLLRASIRHGGDSHTMYFAAQAALDLGRRSEARALLSRALELDAGFSYRYADHARELLNALGSAG